MMDPIMFAIIALIDGIKSDDIYPGYGSVDRDVRKIQENIISIKENTLKVLDDLKDNEIKSLNSNENLVVAGKTETESLFSKRERLISTFENDLQLINEAYRFLVKSYREKNESIRETEVPIYFKDPIENLDVDIPPFTNLKLSNYLI